MRGEGEEEGADTSVGQEFMRAYESLQELVSDWRKNRGGVELLCLAVGSRSAFGCVGGQGRRSGGSFDC